MAEKTFSRYEIFIIALLTFIQFTVILDFMVLSPLGAILIPELQITPSQFGMVVSAYAFSAGASGILAAGFADKYDRKKLLLFFYVGFVVGTFFCGIAEGFVQLLAARIFTGIFGGVIGSIGFAIVTDLFRMEVRGRVMGFMQMAFAGSQVLGLPIGLYLATVWGWHAPFIMIVVVSALVGVLIIFYMKPIVGHLAIQTKRNAFEHLGKTVAHGDYLRAFIATTLLASGGFMLMPFASAYSVNNLGLTITQLPLLYTVTGVVSMGVGPLIGRMSDKIGKFPVFLYGTLLSMAIVTVYCNMGVTPLWGVMIISIIMFTGVSSRMISSQALFTAVPDAKDRGAFMSINASVSQIAGGLATFVAGLIIYQEPDGYLVNYPMLGLVVCVCMLITILQMYTLDAFVKRKGAATSQPATARP
jgi:predicted MFS family arabinose efflux permease